MIVSGKVYSKDLGFMENVNVSHVLPVKNGNYPIVKTVQTDAFGTFKIDVPSTASILMFSHVGYDYDTLTVAEFNAQKLKQVELYVSSEMLPDVVVPPRQSPVTTKKDNFAAIALGLFVIAAGLALFIGSKDKPVKAQA